MRLRFLVAVAVSVVVAGTIGFAQGQGRTQKIRDTFSMTGFFVGNCDEATVLLVDFTFEITGTLHLDKAGNWLKEIDLMRPIGREVYYLGDSHSYLPINDNTLLSSPGEHLVNRTDYVNGFTYTTGNFYKIVVPGYGPILYETGLVVYDPDFNVVFNSGWNQYIEGDLAAVCAYLMR